MEFEAFLSDLVSVLLDDHLEVLFVRLGPFGNRNLNAFADVGEEVERSGLDSLAFEAYFQDSI